MAGASDKARFYLEKYVPELQEYERKEIFTRDEISAIAGKRSDFEHILNARGSKPSDYARYATYEMNLDSLRKKRCTRLGVKGFKGYSGQRTVFFILDRATKKSPGDMGLWMQYVQFCQKENANKKLAKVFTSVLRLKPREWGLWVLAAKWYSEQQGDMTTARSYMQRGLRFCKEEKQLWVEYAKLEMVYLAKLAARRKILGLGEDQKKQPQEDDGENMIRLPSITAADIDPEASTDTEGVNEDALRRLANAPAYTGAIPLAIFDAAMKQFHDDPRVAEELFALVAAFNDVPTTPHILQHILSHLQQSAANSSEAIICEASLRLSGVDISSAAFPMDLAFSLKCINNGMAQLSEKQKTALAEKATSMLLPYLERRDELDADIDTVVVASLLRYLRVVSSGSALAKSKDIRILAERAKNEGALTGADMLQRHLEAKRES